MILHCLCAETESTLNIRFGYHLCHEGVIVPKTIKSTVYHG
jgi:hypothetical protein